MGYRLLSKTNGYIDKAEARIYGSLVLPVYSNVTIITFGFQ